MKRLGHLSPSWEPSDLQPKQEAGHLHEDGSKEAGTGETQQVPVALRRLTEGITGPQGQGAPFAMKAVQETLTSH